MPKSVRLINVDECVTSSGKVVKWADVFTEQQEAQLEVWKQDHKADGHSASATHGMRNGGYKDSGGIRDTSITVYAFASLSGTAFSGTLTQGQTLMDLLQMELM